MDGTPSSVVGRICGLNEEYEEEEEESSTDSDCEVVPPPSKKQQVEKKKNYKQNYRKQWEKYQMFKGWLEQVKGKPDKAYCKVCKKELAVTVTALKKHSRAQYHVQRVGELIDPTLVRIDAVLVDQTMERNVRDAELRATAFLSEHDLSFNLMDHLSDLLPILCPDSKIAVNFKCKRTKMKCVVKNALASHYHTKLVELLNKSYFSVIIDETTDISV